MVASVGGARLSLDLHARDKLNRLFHVERDRLQQRRHLQLPGRQVRLAGEQLQLRLVLTHETRLLLALLEDVQMLFGLGSAHLRPSKR